MGEIKATSHGTITGYISAGCRCDDCRSAWSVYQRERTARVKAEIANGARQVEHGTQRAYRAGCRCDVCRETWSASKASRKAQKADG